ncbi:MAG: bifunctional [glutamate--ammonia ligase]-adenylyl-L-tyrosine phosphorylase/[glutamate--ammonia-ligase] adenylyltransferase [Acidiferrobacterales bacterium]|nr:bifunctional [glutamate--ammonia ligase]-adenylyl-L-tyrosine phosphorylase/[glutamate--ammonia-ligase] adenylyltransferase [Acidiferrobacterales bacterium]
MSASAPLPDIFFKANLPQVFLEALSLYWLRLVEAAEDAGSSDLVTFAKQQEALPRVWCASDFVANWCIRQPKAFATMLDAEVFDNAISEKEWLEHQSRMVTECADENTLDRDLRAFRQQCMVKIAWRDLAGLSKVEETMASVSRLAEVCLHVALECHLRWQSLRAGVPRGGDGERSKVVCLGLGKLGGGELNYSSDIDLIFAYDQSGQTDGDKVMDNQAYFTRVVQKIIGTLDRIDAGGFVFRTDLRLRPNGDSGPVVLSFSAMEHYYQTHGRDWERYALIKARAVAGDAEAGKQLSEMLRPFVYRKYLDYSAFDSIREMKQLIERQLGAGGLEDDVKLGRGGIREIEFLVQNFQLIRGGREQAFRTQSLYTAMNALLNYGLMQADQIDQLTAAYRFLRNTEHRLQMVADRQTQILPSQPVERLRLALSMGYPDWESYLVQLDHHRDYVQSVFSEALTDPVANENDDELDLLAAVWTQQTTGEAAVEVLDRMGFRKAQDCVSLLTEFYGGKLYQAFASVERQRLDRLMPLVLKETASYSDSLRTVSAFISLVEAIGRRSVYLSLLVENPIALKQLLKLCSASSWISRHIGRHPVVLDELIQPLESVVAQTTAEVSDALYERLNQEESGDEEGRMNALREFYHARVLRIAALDVRGIFDVHTIQHSLTQLSEVLLRCVLDDALAIVEKKQGTPPGDIGIIAYGKFAGAELGYHSDLDIVVCFQPSPGVASTSAEYFFSRVGQKLIHLISTRTRAGVLFELDMRLRPSGRSGTLVTSLKGFADYQLANAWTWEHQALVRAKMVIGSDSMREQFESIRSKILALHRDQEKLKTDILDMRKKMQEANSQSSDTLFDLKLDHGGIVDIEFLLQYLVLNFSHQHPSLLQPRSTQDLVEGLALEGLISEDDARFLAATYREYLRRSLQCKLMEQPVAIGQTEMLPERRRVQNIWDSSFS